MTPYQVICVIILMVLALLWMYNTVFMCVAAMALTCIAAAIGGYALAKKRFTGRAMALPKQVILIPLLKEMVFPGIHNTLWAVILPTVG